MGLQAFVMPPYDYDPCLFMGENVILVIYVSGWILFSKEDKCIDAIVEKTCDQIFELEYED